MTRSDAEAQPPDRSWLLPPLAVLGVLVGFAVWWRLFSVSLVDLADFGLALPPPASVAAFMQAEMTTRMLWGVTWLLVLIGTASGIAVALFQCWRSLRRLSAAMWVPLVGINATVAVAGGLVFGSEQTSQAPTLDGIMLQVTSMEACIRDAEGDPARQRDCLGAPPHVATPHLTASRLRDWTEHTNRLTVALVAAVMLAFSGMLAEPVSGRREQREEQIQELAQRQRVLLFVSAVLLVIGVIEIFAFWHWPVVHFTETSPETGRAALSDAGRSLELFAKLMSTVFGVLLTTFLAVVYVPATLILARRADALWADYPLETRMARREKSLFGATRWGELGRLLAIAGPLITGLSTGPLGHLMGVL